jgi:hypothetical protein
LPFFLAIGSMVLATSLIEVWELLLHCICLLLAHSDALRQSSTSVAFGAKPTWIEGESLLIRSKMTRCGSRVGQNAVMHNVALGPLLDSQGEATDGVEPIKSGGQLIA